MAEGWAKKYLSDQWEVRSAGIEAHGLNPKAVKAMKEVILIFQLKPPISLIQTF